MRILKDIMCDNCGHGEEIFHDSLKEDLPTCTKCDSETRISLTKAASFHLKGGKGNGYTDDGRINTGSEGLRRTKAS